MIPWSVILQCPLSLGFPRQEYWRGLPFPSPGDLPDPGVKPTSLALAGGLFTTEPPGKLLSMMPKHYTLEKKFESEDKGHKLGEGLNAHRILVIFQVCNALASYSRASLVAQW